MGVVACVEDLRKQMQRRVPRMFYDYCESGSWTESTLEANDTDLQAIKFRQRVAIDGQSPHRRRWRRCVEAEPRDAEAVGARRAARG